MLAYRLQLKSIRLLAIAEVRLLHYHRRSPSEELVLHLHIAKVRLRILVYLDSSFCPHLQVVIDLMLPQRLVNLRSFLIYLTVIYVFVVY